MPWASRWKTGGGERSSTLKLLSARRAQREDTARTYDIRRREKGMRSRQERCRRAVDKRGRAYAPRHEYDLIRLQMLTFRVCLPVLRHLIYTLAPISHVFSRTPSELAPHPPPLSVTLDTVTGTIFSFFFALMAPVAVQTLFFPVLPYNLTSQSIYSWARVYSDVGLFIGKTRALLVLRHVTHLVDRFQVLRDTSAGVTIISKKFLGRKRRSSGRTKLWS